MMDNDLLSRVCNALMVAGVLGPHGERPLCIGKECSRYEECLYSIAFYKHEQDQIEKHPGHHRILRGERRGGR